MELVPMKIGFVVNDVQTEEAAYTTTRLAMAAVNLGHKSYTFGVGDFCLRADGSIHALARTHQRQELQVAREVPQASCNRTTMSPSTSASTISTC